MFAVRAAPALMKAALVPGERLLWFHSTPWYVAAVSRPDSGVLAGTRGMSSDAGLASLAVAGLAVWFACKAPPRFHLLAGLLVTCIGQVGISLPLARWFFSAQAGWQVRVLTISYAIVLALGLWRALRPISGMGARLGVALVAFVGPLSLFLLAAGRSLDVRFALYGFGPALLAAGVVAALPGGAANSPQRASWRVATAGLAMSGLVLGAARAGHWAEIRQRQTSRREALAATPLPSPRQPYERLFFQRGVNFTAEGPAGYAPGAAREMLDHLVRNGVNAVALVPYGFAPRDRPEVRFGNAWERDEDILALAALARQREIRVLLKPQLWVRPGWPGELHFDSPGDRRKWFDEYERFLEHYARLATRVHADLFCVGVEFGRLTRYEEDWRRLIARARELYPGPLVYAAAQGEEFEGIRFWDALDYIGLNNYYPLTDDLRMDEVVRKVEAVHQRFGRPVVFTEAGFASLRAPHRAPWDESPRELSPGEQARCYEAVLRAFYRQPWFYGVYWWKVGTNGYGGQGDPSHTPWGKPAMEVVARWYNHGGR